MIPFYLRFSIYALLASAAVYYTDVSPFFYTVSAFGLFAITILTIVGWVLLTLGAQSLRALMASAAATQTILLDVALVACFGTVACMFVQGTTPLELYDTLLGYNEVVRWWITRTQALYEMLAAVQ